MDRNVAILLTGLAVILIAVHFLPVVLFFLAVGWVWKRWEGRA